MPRNLVVYGAFYISWLLGRIIFGYNVARMNLCVIVWKYGYVRSWANCGLDPGVDGPRNAVIVAPPKTGGFRAGADRLPRCGSRAEFIREFSEEANFAAGAGPQARRRNTGLFEAGAELPYVPPVGVVAADTLHSQSHWTQQPKCQK
jgi:hypothetical protein